MPRHTARTRTTPQCQPLTKAGSDLIEASYTTQSRLRLRPKKSLTRCGTLQHGMWQPQNPLAELSQRRGSHSSQQVYCSGRGLHGTRRGKHRITILIIYIVGTYT